MRCKTCHYSLEGLSEHRCPECGNAFDPNDPNTFEHHGSVRFSAAFLRRLSIVWVLTFSGVVAWNHLTEKGNRNLAEMLFGGAFCGSILTFLLGPLLILMTDLKVRKAQMNIRNEQND